MDHDIRVQGLWIWSIYVVLGLWDSDPLNWRILVPFSPVLLDYSHLHSLLWFILAVHVAWIVAKQWLLDFVSSHKSIDNFVLVLVLDVIMEQPLRQLLPAVSAFVDLLRTSLLMQFDVSNFDL